MANTEYTFKDIDNHFKELLLMTDPHAIRIVAASVIANQVNSTPVWLQLVSASSGGKSEIITAFAGLIHAETSKPLVWPISDMTPNTFASGLNSKGGEASLLKQMPKEGGILLFKDYTTILNKPKDAKQAIAAQFREVFDGQYSKKTGNNVKMDWAGRIGCLSACTEAIYIDTDSDIMGQRFLYFNMVQPDAVLATKKAQANAIDPDYPRRRAMLDIMIQEWMHELIDWKDEHAEKLDHEFFALDPVLNDRITDICHFCSIARSGISKDFKDRIVFVPSVEAPMRMSKQLIAMYKAMRVMDRFDGIKQDGISEEDQKALFRCAMSSIPKQRWLAITTIGQYAEGMNATGLGMELGYPSSTALDWLNEITALGIATKYTYNHKHVFKVKARFVPHLEQFFDIIQKDARYAPDEGDGEYDDVPMTEFTEEDLDEDLEKEAVQKTQSEQGFMGDILGTPVDTNKL